MKKLILNKNLLIVFSITLTSVMGTTPIVPLFPLIRSQFKLSMTQVGLLISIYMVPGILFSPFVGLLSDKYGRKFVLVPSLVLFGLTGSACFFQTSIEIIFLLRFFQGVGACALISLNIVIIGDLFSGNERIAAVGYNSSVNSIGVGLYPVIGGLLGTFSWNFPFILPLAALIVAALVIYSMDVNEKKVNKLEIFKAFKKKIFLDSAFIRLLLSTLLVFVIFFGAYLTIIPFLLKKAFHLSSFSIGTFISVMTFTSIISSSLIGLISKKISLNRILSFAFLLYSFAMMIIPGINNIYLFILPAILFGIAQGLSVPSIISIIIEIAPGKYRALYMTINASVLRLGQAIGPLIMTRINDLAGMFPVFYTGSVLALIGFLIINVKRKKSLNPLYNNL